MNSYTELRWNCLSGYPLDLRIKIADQEVGQIWRKPNGEPGCLANVDGITWEVVEKPGLIHPSYNLLFADGGHELGVASYGLTGHLHVTLDGVRHFQHRKSSYRVASWTADGIDNLIFQRHGSLLGLPIEGTIVVGKTAEEPDVVPLTILGLFFALNEKLFPQPPPPTV